MKTVMFTMTSNEWLTWLSEQNITLNQGTITATSADSQSGADSSQLKLTLLGHERLLTFAGEENIKFLQGQFTCDLARLEDAHLTLGACCTPKGRMIANFRVLKHTSDLTLSLPADQADALHTHLKKYAMFFRTVKITDTTEQWIRLGLSGTNATSIVTETLSVALPEPGQYCTSDGIRVLALPGNTPRFEIWVEPAKAQNIWQAITQAGALPAPTVSWQLEDLLNGVAWVTEATRELYIPQHLNWQALDGVSFKKGCYTGQEIVARMKYLGKLKSRLYLLETEAENVTTGDPVLNSSAKKSGEVAVSLPDPATGKIQLLAVLRNADVEEGGLTLSNTAHALQLQELPYAVSDS